ncbi:hypothetical protein [Ekhidna sp.]|uniref:hypothetical protein n=1 Tax=Ekhidna sp. TaxID=2608089 RepID=UPI003C7E5051
MNFAFCTCVTSDYLGLAQATFQSLNDTFKGEARYLSLVVDDNYTGSKYAGFEILDLNEIDLDSYGEELLKVKEESLSSRFRWMLKPILLQHLLKRFEAVFWVDPDLYFYNDISPVTQKLESFDVILSPHWRSFNPFVNQNAFFNYFYHGLYNGGFIGVNRNTVDLLENWLEMMHWRLENNRELGILDDQGYLGLFPLMTEKSYIIKDRGHNIAAWNKQECKRTLVDGQVLINKEHTVKFIHFVPDTIKNILNGKDKLLRPHLRKYLEHMLEIEPGMSQLRSYDVNLIKRKTRKALPLKATTYP